MKILHYFLGFPPYRTGGLTKYAFDLAKSQTVDGNEVMVLWPGEIKSYSAEPFIKERKKVEGIRNFELINPLPVSLDEGIKEFKAFTKPCDRNVYVSFLIRVKPDVIHIHTLMGMHREFIQVANQLKIRTVMTSHDYFGFCPKVTLYRYGSCCDDDNGCRNCIQCNTAPLSLKKIQLLQSPLYRWAKDKPFVKKLRKQHRRHFFREETIPDMPNVNVEEIAEKYRKLRAYYVSIYEAIDFIHFNSSVSEKIFKRYVTPKDDKVLSITHSEIRDNRNNGHIGSDIFRIYFLSPAKPFKGWNVLKEACNYLKNQEKLRFELHVYGPVTDPADYMIVHENGYKYSELPDMMKYADIVVAPSICYETFGFTIQEALSYGVPVIVSNHMGVKDIVGESGIVVNAGDSKELIDAFLTIANNKTFRLNAEKGKLIFWSDFKQSINTLYTNRNRCDN